MQNWVENEFAKVEQQEGAAALSALRKSALKSFSKLGFPSSKLEEWRYTNVAPIASGKFSLLSSTAAKPDRTKLEALFASSIFKLRIAFLDGAFAPELSSLNALPEGLALFSIAQLLRGDVGSANDRETLIANLGKHASSDEACFVALNTALLSDGVFVRVKRNTKITDPMLVLSLSSADREEGVVNSRVVVVIEDGAECQIVERFASIGTMSTLSSVVSEFNLGAGAQLKHLRIQEEGQKQYHISNTSVVQQRDSRLMTWNMNFGGKLARHDIHTKLLGINSDAQLFGLTVLNDVQHVDNHTIIEHAAPHCTSNERYKGIYDGTSKGVFSGTIIVRPVAQKTNAYQSNQSILLSERASIDSKPQLKIWADDVKCTHGATVGQLDDDALFYLRSRGISQAEARKILVHAFASEIISSFDSPQIKELLETMLTQKLALSN